MGVSAAIVVFKPSSKRAGRFACAPPRQYNELIQGGLQWLLHTCTCTEYSLLDGARRITAINVRDLA